MKYKRALACAFPHTIPILAGFLFLGIAYGVYANASGLHILYTLMMSALIFAGSMEFVTVSLLLAAFDPVRALLMTLMINARHLFYGISMLKKYDFPGLKKLYLIFGMCDESFSINVTADVPPDVDKGLFMLFVTMLNQVYWVCGAMLGSSLGALIPFNTKGLDFVMTALFVVLFLDRWLKEKEHITSIVSLALAAACLVLFRENFILPAMAMILASLTALRTPIERAGERA
jgi:4-azaleucine resistance transporter AzlC